GKSIFCDIPECHWAKKVVDKGINGGLISGYPDGLFKPNCPVTRAEALVIISKALKDCDLDECSADTVLSQYCDGKDVPCWAKLAVAKALKAGILKNTPTPNTLNPNNNATRAEIAAMLSSVRISMGIDPEPVASCGTLQTGGAAYVEQQEVIKIPTLKVKLEDSVSAHENHVGDHFVARSQECITINGKSFPENSKVYGQIVEVVRPTRNCEGSLKIAFTEIKGGGCKADLPREILCAQVQKEHKPNVISRLVKWPFTWTGALIGDVGRTIGGSIVILGNGSEEIVNNLGTAGGELFQGKFMAAGRSVKDSVVALVRTPIDIARTTLSGTAGLFNITADEIAYVVSADGTKIAQINPNEQISIKFGAQAQDNTCAQALLVPACPTACPTTTCPTCK
ncbi:MAG: S-layer homology domain-containing protein, partial [Candidatus Gastranaerophilaceae bacterium]